jgi:hypothetical protein
LTSPYSSMILFRRMQLFTRQPANNDVSIIVGAIRCKQRFYNYKSMLQTYRPVSRTCCSFYVFMMVHRSTIRFNQTIHIAYFTPFVCSNCSFIKCTVSQCQ